MAITANQLIADAYALLNVFIAGEDVNPNMGAYALRELNRMMGSWAQQRGTIPVVEREVFDTVANQGGPSNPYTIGDGGDFDTDRPPNQASVRGAGLLLLTGTTAPYVEIPLALLTDDMWQAIQIKELSNSQPTNVYYNPTYSDDLGTINLWPVPSIGTNDLVLYLAKQISSFAAGTTSYDFPPGYEDALLYNLAVRLQGYVGRELIADDKARARESLALLKRVNLPMSDLSQDLVFGGNTQPYGYNINTGNM